MSGKTLVGVFTLRRNCFWCQCQTILKTLAKVIIKFSVSGSAMVHGYVMHHSLAFVEALAKREFTY